MCERTELEAVRAVATHGGFGAAARAVGTAPGTLSRRVRRLERSLGTTLVVTVCQRSVVTAAGRLVLQAAERIGVLLSPYPEELRLRHLEVLHTVHLAGSITGAAQRLGLPQPALSRLLRRIEELLGIPVFVRSGAGVTATAAGLDLLAVLHHLRREHQMLQECVSSPARGTAPGRDMPAAPPADALLLPARLRVAVDALSAGRLMAHLPTVLPEARWQTHPFDRTGTLQDVSRGMLDLAVWFHLPGKEPPPVDHLCSTLLFDEPVWLAVARTNPMATRQQVTMAELAGHSWIARPGGPLRTLLDDTCHAAGFVPRVEHVSDNNRTIRALVAADLGIALASPAIPPADIAVVPLAGAPQLRYLLTWNTRCLSRPQALRIAVAIRQWYRTDAMRSPRYWSWIVAHTAEPGECGDMSDRPVRLGGGAGTRVCDNRS